MASISGQENKQKYETLSSQVFHNCYAVDQPVTVPADVALENRYKFPLIFQTRV